jgi:hypothetical protein
MQDARPRPASCAGSSGQKGARLPEAACIGMTASRRLCGGGAWELSLVWHPADASAGLGRCVIGVDACQVAAAMGGSWQSVPWLDSSYNDARFLL